MSGGFLDNFKDKGKDKEGNGGFYSFSDTPHYLRTQLESYTFKSRFGVQVLFYFYIPPHFLCVVFSLDGRVLSHDLLSHANLVCQLRLIIGFQWETSVV